MGKVKIVTRLGNFLNFHKISDTSVDLHFAPIFCDFVADGGLLMALTNFLGPFIASKRIFLDFINFG